MKSTGELSALSVDAKHTYQPIRPIRWNIVVYSILLSEAITVLICLFKGRVVPELFLFAFIVPLAVAPAMMYYSYMLREGLIARLSRSEEKFRTLFDSATDALVVQDRDGKLIDVNSTAHEGLGYTRQEMLEMDISALYPPQSAAQVLQMLERVRKGSPMVFESVHLRKDGTQMPVEVHSRLLDYDGKKVYFSVVRDITERKKAEHMLEAAFHEKEILLREIHHRVKNNMAVIASFLNLQAHNSDSDEVKKILSESRNRIRSMALVHEKLYLTGNLANIDLRHYLESLLRELFSSYHMRVMDISYSLDVDDIEFDIRNTLTCGLIINELVSNAMKHAFEGVENPAVRISLKAEGAAVVLTVSDNGRGISNDVNLNGEKTLGLQIVDSLVGQLGGSLGVHRAEGTSFAVRFPASQASEV